MSTAAWALASSREANTAEWFSAIGSVGALLVALALLGRDLLDRRRAADQQRSAQASKVAISQPQCRKSRSEDPQRWDLGYQVIVTNRSEDVIAEVVANVWLVPDGHDPSGTIAHQSARLVIGRLDGASTDTRMVDFTVPRTSDGAAPHTAHSSLSFVDAAGRRWERDSNHRLKEIK